MEVYMGFRVEIDDADSRILDLLKKNPVDIFERLFGGYLLFLVGGSDEAVFSWLSKNIVTLDSLTDKDVAFAIFAKNFKFKMHVPYQQDNIEVNKKFDVSIEDIKNYDSITKLVTSGKYGWVNDGDEINAITYGTDEVAKLFGVTGDLPCMLLFDCIQEKPYKIFHLKYDSLQVLIDILRVSVQCLRNNRNYEPYMRIRRSILELEREKDRIQFLIDWEEREPSIERYIGSINQLRNDISSALKNSDIYGVVSAYSSNNLYKSVIEVNNANEVIEACKIQKDFLYALNRAINILEKYSTRKWPLKRGSRFKYISLYRRYIQELLSNLPVELETDTPDQCIKIKEILMIQRLKIINEILNLLPNNSTIEVAMQKLADDEKIQNNKLKQKLEAQLTNCQNELHKLKPPSFIDCFSRESNKKRIVLKTQTIINYAPKLLDLWDKISKIVH